MINIDMCPLCSENPKGGVFNIRLKCCEIRYLATCPDHIRRAAYEKVNYIEGEAAMIAYKNQVSEMYRWRLV